VRYHSRKLTGIDRKIGHIRVDVVCDRLTIRAYNDRGVLGVETLNTRAKENALFLKSSLGYYVPSACLVIHEKIVVKRLGKVFIIHKA
jgi:hypothetical protein